MLVLARRMAVACALGWLAPRLLTAQESTTVGGYGEIHYVNPSGPTTPATLDVRRFVIYIAHTFSERLSLRSELEVEDAKVESSAPLGEVALERVVVVYRLAVRLALSYVLLIVPDGMVHRTTTT